MMNQLFGKRLLLWCIAAIAVLSVGQLPPISQDLSYHAFADTRTYWGIPNMLNVVSNIPFLFIGLYGLGYANKHKVKLHTLYWGAMTFSVGVTLVAIGSSYYHWQPNNETLLWDRLPMTIGFMGLYAMVVSAFVNNQSGVKLLPWLIVIGIISVLYWSTTEALGQGDLRAYILVQFLPMILILVILLFFKVGNVNKSKLILALLWYASAKCFELNDLAIMTIFKELAGHSLKHLAAAIACYYVIAWIDATAKHTRTS